jgi:hypothetical protein
MNRTAADNDLNAGPWCRFCPAKLVCPLMNSLFGAAMKANPATIPQLSDESLGRSYQYTAAVKFYLKALEDEAYRRSIHGHEVPGTKLVNKKANRVYKVGAAEVIKARFGEAAMTEPELKSPSAIEKLGHEAKQVVAEWAYTPQTGLTLVLADDKRVAVKVETSASVFAAAAVELEKDR